MPTTTEIYYQVVAENPCVAFEWLIEKLVERVGNNDLLLGALVRVACELYEHRED